ncbi:ATV_HP_G0103620.mRNA.1.CDS.1 [Saccharomyces cerevisiae]|nr:ATV_HP_G0103620.mRNA.1.CDS.1 [Saccharomyces cerevisiae]CAI6619375.1 ATV_HP_G0103620.mRNA.1.CDS.1 [Saccharomyces cerevisiae]
MTSLVILFLSITVVNRRTLTAPELAPPASKINFQRSPSYIELFQGMRVVLDKHDAHYNWKRLASQVSLSEGLKVNTEEDAAIINKKSG